ncbi:MAG: sulfotransferase [Rudaea sp.]|nr:sulfotransferase [Rudaea sp.]
MAQRTPAAPPADANFTVSPNDAAERLRGLLPAAAQALQRAGACLQRNDFAATNSALAAAAALAPEHPEVLRLAAVLDIRTGQPQRAIGRLRALLARHPGDVLAHGDLGDALRAAGDLDAAYALWRRACERVPDSATAWFILGSNLDQDARLDDAQGALERAVALAPDFVAARKALADVLVDLGQIERAAAEYRTTLRMAPAFGEAWSGLANIRTARFEAAEIAQMEHLDKYTELDDFSRASLEFALAKAYEDEARYADAFATLHRANERMRKIRDPWDAAAFAVHVDEVLAAFAEPVAQSRDGDLGSEVIFIVGLPRSGSTLTEQILASHAQVEGAGELGDLMQVVREESMRQRALFPRWVAKATPSDWERMGRRYLELTRRWRTHHARFTDKQPYNWLLVGAARAMLPGARFVDCRRDPLETCWSCYKQVFPSAATFSYDLADIAAFWKAYDRAAKFWAATYPGSVRDQTYEALLADPGGQTRDLLEFCGLAFDPACLDFHRNQRPIHTASAAQVREPMRRDTARAARYGELLAPLQRALGIEPSKPSTGP